jgi:hypothetical protein
MDQSLPVAVREVRPVTDARGRVHLQEATVAVDGVAFEVRDVRRLLEPEPSGRVELSLVAFRPEVSQLSGTAEPRVTRRDGAPVFVGRVTDVRAGEEGSLATLEIGPGTVGVDAGARPPVAPDDRVAVTADVVHVAGVDAGSGPG